MQSTPRKLTTLQKAVLIQVLREFPDQRVEVQYCPLASDALSYAQDFLGVFKAIGWDTNDGAPSENLNSKPSGLAFLIDDKRVLPPSAEALRDALRIYGIEIATIIDSAPSIGSNGFNLIIGLQS